jgi:hypothetical protein
MDQDPVYLYRKPQHVSRDGKYWCTHCNDLFPRSTWYRYHYFIRCEKAKEALRQIGMLESVQQEELKRKENSRERRISKKRNSS